MASLNTSMWFWCYAKHNKHVRSNLFNIPFTGCVTILLINYPHPHRVTNVQANQRLGEFKGRKSYEPG
jgi:hypothetical protein